MRWYALVLIGFAFAGCGISVAPMPQVNAQASPYQYKATTFWYSNNTAVPLARALRKAALVCDQPKEDISHRGPYGLGGTYFVDFSCKPVAH